jgi:hypothetical protein
MSSWSGDTRELAAATITTAMTTIIITTTTTDAGSEQAPQKTKRP